MKLVMGDKNYSSWSMRPWLLLTHLGIAFEEVGIELGEPGTPAAIRALVPSSRVPCLVTDEGETIWDSLAIAETLAERFPGQPLWPREAAARARARSVSAEMHAGFAALRRDMSMNIRASFPGQGGTPEALADVGRIDELWCDCLARYGGPFLFGESFGIADAMYAPVAMRFNTWQPKLSAQAAGYARHLTAFPVVQAWIEAARAETHHIASYDRRP